MRYLLISLAFLVPMVSHAQVVINEIMYDLPGSDNDREWIEIYNSGSDAVDLTNWIFFEQEVNHTLTNVIGGNILPAGGYAIIAQDDSDFLTDWPGFSGILFDSSWNFLHNNNGETIALKSNATTTVYQVTYDPDVGAKGDGKTLSLIGTNWKAIVATPGAKNDTTPPVITLLGDNPQRVWSANFYVEEKASAVDVVDGEVSANIIIDASAVKNGEPGSYIVTYTVTDVSGNTRQSERTVKIVQSSGGSSNAAGEVLGEATVAPTEIIEQVLDESEESVLLLSDQAISALSPAEKQTYITNTKNVLASKITQLIELLQDQLAAATAAEGF